MGNKVWKNMKNLAYSIPIALMSVLPGCEPDNAPPTAKLNVNPAYGEIPVDVRMRVTGQDPDGVEDIKQYILYIGDESVKSNTPIDITRTFTNEGKIDIYGEVIDSKNQSNKTPASQLELTLTEGIEQSAVLSNGNEIVYSATLKKRPNAELTVNKNGNLFFKQSITDNSQTEPDYQKTFKYDPDKLTKGDYEFILKSGDLEKKTNVTIPNYKPALNLSGLNTNFEEESEIVLDLTGKISDKNPEDNPVSINSVSSVEGKTRPTLNNYNLKIKSFWNKLGEYKIKLNVRDANEGLEEIIFKGNITQGPYEWIVNPFVSTNPNGAAYDLLTTKAQRDAYVQEKLLEDWTNTIPYRSLSPSWVCTEFSGQLMTNFHGFPGETRYSGFDLDSIYYYGGTYKDNGKYGLPVYFVAVHGTIAHNMNAILTGDDITKFEDWCFIEPQTDTINVKPGQYHLTKNCWIYIRGPPKNRNGEQSTSVPIIIFNVDNGVGKLEWINNENPNSKIIKNRK
ncbi:hypothetical protein KBC25_03585 [Candidatus Pacearchaeota archaeon]|nr:hypothetical protein [Candidatus Pacearchaeota archaeon]